ncbi:MAG: carboxyl-terminal processing protease [Candidatus Azotimanducaceae bacterium]|jgi:carboxyl-terminal processing protease
MNPINIAPNNTFQPPAIILLLSMLALTGCGGGGGGSSTPAVNQPNTVPSASPPATGFAGGSFEPYRNFRQMCESPRSGADANGRIFPDAQGTSEDENNWLRSWSNELYLWYDEIADTDPANQTTPDYFELMQTFERTPSGARKDKFHFTIPTDDYLAESQSGIVGGYGARFLILESTPPRSVVVAYTAPDTPATDPSNNLRRGTELLEVDGADIVNGNDVDAINTGLFPGDAETHTFLVRDVDNELTRTVTMTSGQFAISPVQNLTLIETELGAVGYLTFNDHNRTAEAALVNALTQLRDANISDLVLDLRYNGGGLLTIANQLAFMIAGDQAAGQVFESLEFNDQHPKFNPVTGNPLEPDEFITSTAGFSLQSGTPLPTLSLSRIFILTGPGTCSASESIINGLRGIDVEVIQIGDTTCGKPYGFYPFDNCGTTYFSIQFRGVNQKGFGDYADGFSPSNLPQPEGVSVKGCLVSDDFTRLLGDPLESRLRAALQYRTDGECPSVVGSSLARAKPLIRAGKPIATGFKPGKVMIR